jgi:Methyltransferase domain
MQTTISESYRTQQAALHAAGNYGLAALQYGKTVSDLLAVCGARTLLDYGCGSKRSLLQALGQLEGVTYEGYDPAVPAYAKPPRPADLVACIDVLEHIEPEFLDNVLDELGALCAPFGFFTIHTGPAGKVLLDGRNAHLIQQPPAWWLPRLQRRFKLLRVQDVPNGFAVVVQSLRAPGGMPAGH